ncbi:MAG TPA: ParB/RepB/Spo0J family partition protein [Deltaproteobacteria bacterium]|nr:ParB/RepB/Spo0J family partition protein [Deltaproteobacteria bacterium]
MSRPARVGRGLASLIPDSALEVDAVPTDRDTLKKIPLDELQRNPEQPREVFDKDKLAELTDSIRVHGILSPLVVRKGEGRYILIAGERRMRAAAAAGLTEVPVIVREADEAKIQLELALVENLQRTDLNPLEAARGFRRLVHDYGYTQDQVARAVGKNRATIANAIRLLNLPGFALAALQDGRITAGHARALLRIANKEDDLRRILHQIITSELSVRQVEKLVEEQLRAPAIPATEHHHRENVMEYAERLFQEALQVAVSITPRKKGGGRIQIEYSDDEELQRLITLVQGEPT